MSDIEERRTVVQTKEHQSYLMHLMMKKSMDADGYVSLMQKQYPEYTTENYLYDRRRIRQFGMESLMENAQEILLTQINVRMGMLEIAWDNYHDARNGVEITEENRSNTNFNKDGKPVGSSEGSTIRTTQTSKDTQYWWEQIMRIQEKIESLLGLHHINVNLKSQQDVYVKMYRVDPARNWPPPPGQIEDTNNIVEGSIVSDRT